MKTVKYIVLIVVAGFLCFLGASYLFTTPDDRLTLQEAAQEAQQYVDTPVCIVGEGCNTTGDTINFEKYFPAYAMRDDIPDYYFFPTTRKDENIWSNTIGIYLLPDKFYDRNYWQSLEELKGTDGTNKLYNLGGRWYGVPENSQPTTVVGAVGHIFTKAEGPRTSHMTFSKFEQVLQEYRENIKKQQNDPIYRMKALKQRIFMVKNSNHAFIRWYDSAILDNVNHYLSCDELPTQQEVDAVIKEHREVVEEIIKSIGDLRDEKGNVRVYWDEEHRRITDGNPTSGISVLLSWGSARGCGGTNRAEILITYNSHSQRVIIEKIISAPTFFGVPYRLMNI